MFKPNFQYTHKIVNSLTQISAAREIILNSPLVPKWEVTLRREAIIRSAHSSTSIEGNRLSLEQVSDLAYGREVMATRKDKQEVLNYLRVLENTDKLTDGKKITEKNILKVHKKLTQGTLDNPSDCGTYRNRYVVVVNRLTGEVVFKPPANEDVPVLVKRLIEWLNSDKAKGLDPVIEAGIVHYEFVRIHPFVDGNGRTARVLAALIFYLRGFDTKQFFCLDDYYDSDRPSYYKVLQSVDQKTLNLTKWLEYFVEGVQISIAAVKERVVKLSSERLRRTKKGQIALTERQMRIVEFINQHGKITNKYIREMFKISAQAAHKEVTKMIKLEVIKPIGKGRGLSYQLN
ncbi:MAG TPA: Fic family protein [Candidatus Wunengus sp. YC63]|uniref:Fic family protein n=1 Tax=Candidatus Wunengus sp. YC63 TaxID=3367699 RepID=UPI0040278875